MSSSHPQKPFLPVRLLRTLSSFLDWVWAKLISLLAILRQAWRNLKIRKSERLINKPKAGSEEEKTAPEKQSFPADSNATRGGVPTSASQSQAHDSSKGRKYGQYIMWPFVAIGRLFKWLFLKADLHSGGITAIATIAIGVLTVFYVKYSKGQWETMQKQLTASEDSQSAQLAADEFEPEMIPDPVDKDTMMIRGTITITNYGLTVAREIYKHGGYSSWGGVSLPSETDNGWKSWVLTPTPIPNGPSLGQGKSIPIFVDEGEGRWSDISAGKWFFGFNVAVSYRDIFGRPHVEHECFVYSAKYKRFIRGCPVTLRNFVIQTP